MPKKRVEDHPFFMEQSAPIRTVEAIRMGEAWAECLWPLVEVFPDCFTDIGNTEGPFGVVFGKSPGIAKKATGRYYRRQEGSTRDIFRIIRA